MNRNPPLHDELQPLLETPRPASIGPTRRNGVLPVNTLREKVRTLPLAEERSKLLLALLFFWHDHLDDSHRLSQEIETPDGSLLHGMMHRREPDYSNSKYWFRQVGRHPAHARLPEMTKEILGHPGATTIASLVVRNGLWDPLGFVDACQRWNQENLPILEALQKAEARAVLDYILAG